MPSNVPTTLRTIRPEQLHQIHASGKAVELIDVRTPAEYRSAHASIARLEPLETLDPASIVSTRALGASFFT